MLSVAGRWGADATRVVFLGEVIRRCATVCLVVSARDVFADVLLAGIVFRLAVEFRDAPVEFRRALLVSAVTFLGLK